MKTWKTIIILILIIGVLSFGSYIIFLILNPSTIIRGKAVEYHTKEELSDLYWQNEELLNSVKNSVLSNKKVLQALIDEQDGDTGIYTKHDEVYFSQEEWSDIVSVFENLHPYMIMMERKGRPIKLYIDFASQKLDVGSKRTTLYWFTDKKEIEYQKEHSLADSVAYTQIDGNWYIVEETFHW
jgi:hypothetical protein